jgi:hypothetical protein
MVNVKYKYCENFHHVNGEGINFNTSRCTQVFLGLYDIKE